MSDDLQPDERAALDTWTTPKLSDDLADRVLAEALGHVDEEPPKATAPKSDRNRRRRWMALAAGAAAAAAIAVVTDESSRGGQDASTRTTVAIGERGTAVLEAGSGMAWKVGRRGDAFVKQDRGNVFYRVERGGPFVVDAAGTKVRVLGTSFRVEVQNVKTKQALLVGATAGALAASAVIVTVYEGRVDAAAASGNIQLEAGEGAVIRPGAAPMRTTPTLKTVVKDTAAEEVPAEAVEAAMNEITEQEPAAMRRALAVVRAEKRQLEERLAEAREALEEAPERANRTYDLDEATLKRMAKECALAWDTVSTGVKPPTLPDESVEKLSLSPDERAVVDAKFAETHAALTKMVRQTYTAVTGDTNTGSLATEAMFFEVRDKTDSNEMQRIFQRLANERAGLAAPPADGSSLSPVEQMFRAVTSSGDRLEGAIGSELGPEQARRIRDLRGGWNSRSTSSHGCPK